MTNRILLVEDNSDDAMLTTRVLKKSNASVVIERVEDGQEALDYLFNDENEIPSLILLDLKMPRVDGLEVLYKLKTDQKKKTIPIVMLTSSKEESDIIKSYALGVNAYIVKPVDYEQYVTALTQLGHFWLSINEAPS